MHFVPIGFPTGNRHRRRERDIGGPGRFGQGPLGRDLHRNALVEQERAASYVRVGVEALDHDVLAKMVGDGHEAHAIAAASETWRRASTAGLAARYSSATSASRLRRRRSMPRSTRSSRRRVARRAEPGGGHAVAHVGFPCFRASRARHAASSRRGRSCRGSSSSRRQPMSTNSWMVLRFCPRCTSVRSNRSAKPSARRSASPRPASPTMEAMRRASRPRAYTA